MLSFEEFLTESQQEMMNLRKRIAELRRDAARSPAKRKELESAEAHLAQLMRTSTL